MRIDCFSGRASDLRGSARTPENVLAALRRHPRVSVWDMGYAWLRGCLETLQRQGKIKELEEPYPWLRFKVLDGPLDE